MQRLLRYAKLLTNGCLAMFDARVVSGGISKPRHRLQSPDILHQRVFPAATYTGGEHSDTSEHTVLQLAQAMSLGNVSLLKGIFPQDTGARVPGSSTSCAQWSGSASCTILTVMLYS